MWCYISLPNSLVLEVQIDAKSEGQECLDKVCAKLGIIEVDYFGLQYEGRKGEPLWLNTRNRITRQISRPAPYRFRLRVKFFVQPHLLLQETTRHQFFLHVRQEFWEGNWRCDSLVTNAKLLAFVAQAEYGEHTHKTPCTSCAHLANRDNPPKTFQSPDLLPLIHHQHSKLKGVSSETAEYRMLQLISETEDFGVEYHKVRNNDGVRIRVGVGPEGISLYHTDNHTIEIVSYPTIQMATHAGKCVFLTVIDDTGDQSVHGFKLVSQSAANGLYRCVTEKHSFYRCDTVRNAVSAQFSRDLKGTLASLFNENTQLGKNYIFDIRRTCREVHDHARRKLYTSGVRDRIEPHTTVPMETESEDKHEQCPQDVREKLERLEDAMMCRVCLDQSVNTVFCPCGHTCCSDCAVQLTTCPICRQNVDNIQHVYIDSLVMNEC